MAARSIIIDTDPGQDDAVAILVALASPEFDVRGITTVAGNVPLALTSVNARKMCELAGRPDVGVYAGCPRPMVRDLVTAEHVHGRTGLDGAELPEPTMDLQPGHAVDFLVSTLSAAAPRSVTLCTLGPLTNLAMALVLRPEIVEGIAEVVMMGGGFFEGGNTTPTAEFNVYVDPHAMAVVLSSGVELTMLPLDVTHQALTTAGRLAAFRALGTPVGDAVAGLLDFFDRYDSEKYGTDGGPLHDPCVIAYLLQPDLFGGRECRVDVEIASELTMGMTSVDWWGVTGEPANCTVIRTVDADGYFALLTERIARL